jgi:hypothetical protein
MMANIKRNSDKINKMADKQADINSKNSNSKNIK